MLIALIRSVSHFINGRKFFDGMKMPKNMGPKVEEKLIKHFAGWREYEKGMEGDKPTKADKPKLKLIIAVNNDLYSAPGYGKEETFMRTNKVAFASSKKQQNKNLLRCSSSHSTKSSGSVT
jgi:hypothetical protein